MDNTKNILNNTEKAETEKNLHEIIKLAGITNKDCGCNICSKQEDHDNIEDKLDKAEIKKANDEVLAYDLSEFSKDVKLTFDSNNFENWLDVFYNFKLKLLNKGFDENVAERIISEILYDYISNSKSYDCVTSKEKHNDLNDIKKLAGLDVLVDSKFDNKEENNKDKLYESDKNLYILDINFKKSNNDKKSKGKLKILASNEKDLENLLLTIVDYIKEILEKGVQKGDFSVVKNVEDIKECEIVLNRDPYLIRDRRINSIGGLDTLRPYIVHQRFAKYGDNSMTYESERKLMESKNKKNTKLYKNPGTKLTKNK